VKADRFSWIWLALFCVFGFLHSALYAFTNPVFESPDEPGHLEFINRIASGGGLPNQYDSKQFLPEGHQNPLYYFVAGSLLRVTGGPIKVYLPPSQTAAPAPYFDHRSDPFGSGRDRTVFYALRLLGCLLVGLTVVQVGRAARRVMPVGHVWMAAPMFVAALPQFAFIGASISNDILVTTMGACAVFAAACCAMEPSVRRNWIALGIYVGLAYLAKKNGIILAPAAVLLLLGVKLYGLESGGKTLRNGLWMAAAALILFLPVLLRNQILYRDSLGNRMEAETLYNLAYFQSLDSFHFRYIVPHDVPVSFVSQFGWMVVEVKPTFVWRMIWGIDAALLLGLGALFDRRVGAFALFCLTGIIANAGGLVYYNLQFPQAQGRLLFPSLGCIALLCTLGLYEVSCRVAIPRKALVLAPLAVWFLWFDVLCFYTNQNFYAWFGSKLGF
jgi:hypothetical protein